jgi:hypothetical protein
MVIAAIMLTTYFLAFYTKKSNLLIAFRASMLLLIISLVVTWVVSMILGQSQLLFLGLAVLFILLYIYS